MTQADILCGMELTFQFLDSLSDEVLEKYLKAADGTTEIYDIQELMRVDQNLKQRFIDTFKNAGRYDIIEKYINYITIFEFITDLEFGEYLEKRFKEVYIEGKEIIKYCIKYRKGDR